MKRVSEYARQGKREGGRRMKKRGRARDRERERERKIYIYREREREREKGCGVKTCDALTGKQTA